MSLRDEIREENRKNFQNMNSSQKIKHFWHYYKIHVLVALFALAFVVYLILHYTVFRENPYGFSVYALGSNYYMMEDTTKLDTFINEFAAREGINTEEYQVVFNVSNTVDPKSTDTFDMATDMKLTSVAQDGEMDILIGTPEQIDFYVKAGFYNQTLEQLLPEDLFRELDEAGLIYYYYHEESDREFAIGIYISEVPRIQELELYDVETEAVLALVTLSERTERSVEFVRYIFETPETEN